MPRWPAPVSVPGEGGMLPDEQAANTRYMYELASARFGYSMEKVQQCQAFHFKGGQGAKTGTGGQDVYKVKGRIAKVRGLNEGEAAVPPASGEALSSSFCNGGA
ncbi:MAG: glutamate synthase-related protein [Candidatus Thiodiazotropha sp. (ex. Lucinoma kazani)]